MSKIETIKENWSEIITKLMQDKQELAQFLRFAAGMYKQSFSDAILIYHQNPNATKVATLETWNKLGRLVNKGEHSIAVFGEGSRAKHLFDISQTNGKRIPELWKLTEDLSSELIAVINKKYGRDCKNIQETIAAISVDNIRPHLSEMMYATGQLKLTDNDLKTYQQSVVSAVRFMVSTRCELDSDMKISGGINLNAADFFKEKRDLVRFCTIVQKSAKDTLLEMEREIVQILRQRREKSHELQTKPDRTVSSRTGVHGGQQRTENAPQAHRQVGQNVAGVGESRVPDGSADIRNGGSVADNSENNRQRSGEPLSGTGRAVQTGKSPSADVLGNSVVGENAAADDRTHDYGGNSLSVEALIERYKNADFNRRLDSYEIAGRMLYEAEYNEFKSGAVAFFDRFEADKYSETQAEEIRTIIKSALENREKTRDFIDVSIPDEPTTNEPVILNNEIVETSDLPPFIDEKLIAEILKHDRFFKVKRDKIAEFFENTPDIEKRAEFMKKAFNYDYTELDYGDTRLGYKADESGVLMWEGNFLSRTSESVFSWDLVQSLVADLIEKGKYLDKKAASHVYAKELESGDKISIEGEIWTVQNAGTYLISLKNDSGEHRNIYNAIDAKWYEVLDEIGFEFIHEDDLSKPVFAEPEQQEFLEPEPIEAEPVPQVEQLSFFGDTEPSAPILPPKNIPKRTVAFSTTAPDDEMIDYILKCGSNEPKSLERIVAQFQKEKSAAENADFLRKEFGEDGRGYDFVSQDKSHTTFLAAWFDNSGITAAQSNTAFPQGEKVHLSWKQVAERISVLLDKGEYCSQDIIDRAAELEMTYIADRLCMLERDVRGDYGRDFFIPKEMVSGGFPERIERVKMSMLDKNTLQKYIEGMTKFVDWFEKSEKKNRYRYTFKELLQQLKDLQIPRKEFITNVDFKFEPKFFITEDEKDRLLTLGGNVEGGKFRIEKFFKEEHTAKEKANFLKNEYGIGGSGRSGYNTFHDSKGLKYTKDALTSNDCEVLMKWNEVAKRIDVLIAEDKYITQSDIDELIRSAKNTIEHRKIESDYDKAVVDNAKKILAEYGVDIQENTDISETKSPVEKLIEKAEAAGVPVETVSKEKAVFMDVRDETFIAVQQVDEGIEYSVYASDLTVIDGGIWEMDEGMDLKSAAADLLATMKKNIAPVPDYDNFIDLADGNSDKDIPAELAKIKADVFAKINPPQENISENSEKSAVNSPEKISVPDNKQPKSGVPVTYHFSPENVAAGGAKSRFNSNIEAIKTLQKVEAENRFATHEEQAVMAKYVGWGGIPQAFVSDKVAESISGNLGEAAPSGWENEQKELLELLTPEEYKAARASTLTSFYTPPDVTDGIYQALAQFGFEGGNVLEPSMGVGNFFAKMPEDMRDNSKLYGVELDSISGRIAQQLYPSERIQIKGFEQTNFNNNSFDVVIGNIPFGDYRVSDKKYDKYNFKIHDYFAAKAVDKVKPNGVVALVTSKFTMDKLNEKARRYLAERCDLLGAVRLPAGTFKDADSVTTDILFLKKRETMTVEIPDWVHMSQTEDGIPCNKYFVDNPEMVLGKMAWDERMKGKFGDDSRVTTCYANKDIPLSEQLKNAISKIEGKIETVKEKVEGNENIKVIPADPSVRNFTHTLVDGKLYFRENEIMTEVQETGKTLDRMLGMHKIRQAAMAVIDAQAADCSDEELLKLQADLNAVYDKFKKSYGNITDVMNERCFRHDDDFNTLAALEIVDTEKKTVEKSEIFFKRTIQPELEIASVDTPQEALQVSIDRIGKVDIEYMAGLVGTSPEQLIADLGNDIFRNPAKIRDEQPYSGYEDASEYLSGNVREKLKIAQDYTKHIDSSFEKNVTALEKVIPKNLEAGEISVRIGANWIDVEDYNKFLEEYAKADMVLHPVVRTRMGEYKIEGKNRDYSVAASGTYGTSRMNSYNIFENLLNQRDIVVRDRCEEDGKVWYEVNAKETQLAKEKARQMKEGFKNWIWQDINRREKYVEKYNNLFNCIRGREYDGSYQSFPAMNPAIKLRPHQKNAILRGKLGGNTLLAHCVGAGKSFEMVATTMEKKRLGLIGKGCVVVPKHLTMQMASEWIRLYPNAKLLVAHPEDFSKDNRQKFIARCVTGDYDAVIMSFTQFEKIPMSDEYRRQFLENELDEIMDALNEVDDEDRVSVKTLERQKRKIEERLEKLTSSKKDNSLCFEKLGFDYLVCDEAHNYKNCFVATKMSNVAGVQTTAAQKSEDMLMKTQYLNEKYGCNNILFATGTPISNSMVELYVMKRYLRPDLLEKAGLENFDDWAGTFGEVVNQLEMKPAGDGYRMKNRFSKFVNIPELMQMYKEFADIQTADMLKLPVPKLKTGEPIVVTAKPNDLQKEYMQELARRSEAIHNGNVDPSEDNMLKIVRC